MNKKRIIIVGAGPGGLTTAMILAHRGFDVTVFESKDTVGGRNAALRLGPYTFDTGPTFLMMDFILKEMFAEAGRKVEDYLSFTQLEMLYDLKFVDQDIHSLFDTAAMKDEIRLQFPGKENALDAFLRKEGKRFEMLFPCMQKSYSSVWSMFSWPLIRALPWLGLGRSLFSILGSYFHNERLQLSFTFQSKYLGMSPWECPGLFTMIPYVEHSYGIFHVAGGLNKISQAMATVAIEEGARINRATPVRSLIVDHRTARGVELETGEKVFADEVVLNADFAYAMTNLVPPDTIRKYGPEKLRKKDYSCSTFMLYLGLDTLYSKMAHHTVVFAEDYVKNVDEIFHRKVLSNDMSLYFQNAGVTDSTLAPAGASTLYVLVPVPNETAEIDWDREKMAYRKRVIDVLEWRTPMHDLHNHITVEKIVTPADWDQQFNIFLGATFNLSHQLSQLLYFRPHNRFSELRNCYLVGGGTHPGSGLPTIYESARISANLISKKHGVPFHRPSPRVSVKEPVTAQGEHHGDHDPGTHQRI